MSVDTIDTRNTTGDAGAVDDERAGTKDAGTDAGDGDGSSAGGGAGRTRRPLDWRRVVPAVVLAAALVVAVVGLRAWWQAEHDPDLARAGERDAVLVAASTHVATLNTLDHDAIEEGLDAWGDATTGMLHDQLTGVDDADRSQLAALGTVSTGRVLDAAVLELDGDTATVLAAVEVTVVDERTPGAEPVVKRNRFAADLRQVDGRWLVEDLQQVAVSL